MRLHSRICAVLLLAAGCASSAVEPEKIRIILVGDSTMAARTGYGDALCSLFTPDVACINVAKGGRSSGSFRAEGLWDQVLSTLRDSTAGKNSGTSTFRATYVLIQFGHNDQPGKPGRSTDLATEFPVNMARYVDEVKAAGAIPVLVTPLTRRIFREGVLHNDLKPWAEATRKVSESKKAPMLDLNAESAAAVSKMGGAEADTFAMAPPPDTKLISEDKAKTEPNGAAQSKFDYTHLGEKGANYFARMVANELAQAVPSLAANLKPRNAAAPTK